MNLTDARKAKIPRKYKFQVGRGESSGLGKQSGRGQKGQWARQGTSFRTYFEGGQMSIIRRIPKRGFNNKDFAVRYEVVHMGDLETSYAAGETVDEASLRAKGLLRRHLPVKLLNDGELTKKLVIKVHRASKSAIDKVSKAGGQVEMLTPPPPPKPVRIPAWKKGKVETKAAPVASKDEKGAKADKGEQKK